MEVVALVIQVGVVAHILKIMILLDQLTQMSLLKDIGSFWNILMEPTHMVSFSFKFRSSLLFYSIAYKCGEKDQWLEVKYNDPNRPFG